MITKVKTIDITQPCKPKKNHGLVYFILKGTKC